METREALILTCEKHKKYADALVAGIKRYWPEMPYRVFWDTDRSTETSLPDDVRDAIRRVPYLRKPFDLPYLTDVDTMYLLDSDILLYGHPHDFGPRMYQAALGATDDPAGLMVWEELGYKFDIIRPRFCAGMYSCSPSMFRDNRNLMIDYVRLCIKHGHDRTKYPGIACEQSLVAGLWRMTYPDNMLDPTRYPANRACEGMVMWHMCGSKISPVFNTYMKEMNDWQRQQTAVPS